MSEKNFLLNVTILPSVIKQQNPSLFLFEFPTQKAREIVHNCDLTQF